MNHTEATQHIKATLAAFGPAEAINMTQDTWAKLHEAMSVLIEQPAQQEPVARQYQNRDGVWKDFISEKHYKDTLEDGSWPIRNLYTSPPAQRTWVGLTDEERVDLWKATETDNRMVLIEAIEAKLKEMNT